MGHRHHDHIVCLTCGRIEEFFDERIEHLQEEACRRKGFELVNHHLRLEGYCRACAKAREERAHSSVAEE
jgi:Fur family ferric uptake transcriptional regulator